jgi:hypothetical protein
MKADFNKYIKLGVGVCSALVVSCVKTNGLSGSAALNIVNAVNLSNPLVTNFTPLNPKGGAENPLQYYATANQIGFAGSYESGSYPGIVDLSLSQIDDTSIDLWQGQLNLPSGSIHTLFFAGDTLSMDTLLSTDLIPYYPAGDSVAGLRFVNLVQNGLAISVNIQGNPPTQTEFSDLGFKQISAFKQYSANSNIPGYYTFEIRYQLSDSLLSVFTWNYAIFKNQTVVIAGSQTNDNSPIIPFSMNNY